MYYNGRIHKENVMLRLLLKKYYIGMSVSVIKPKLDIRTVSLMDIIHSVPCSAGLSNLLDVVPMKYLLMPHKQVSINQAVIMMDGHVDTFDVYYILNKLVRLYLFDVIYDMQEWCNAKSKIRISIRDYVYYRDEKSYSILMDNLNQLIQKYKPLGKGV